MRHLHITTALRPRAAVGTLLATAILCAPLAAAAQVSTAAALQGVGAASRANASLPTHRLIIKYRSGAAGATAAASAGERALLHRGAQMAAQRAGLQMQLVRVGAFDTHVMRVDRALPQAGIEQLARDIMASDPNVEYAEPDRILQPQATPNDTQYGQQWHYFEATGGMNLPAAWDKATGTGVVTAVIDTGYRPHADLAANVLPGYDFIADTFVANDGSGRDNNAQDPGDWIRAGECGTDQFGRPVPAQDEDSSWHGTHVAGTVAAVTNNGSGVAGVAYNAKVVPVRALGKCGGYTSDIADGIVWASGGTVGSVPANANPARVINLSLGGPGSCDTTTQNAINSARSRSTVVVVAAGNDASNASNYSPASCSGIIVVAATNRSGGRAYYSNFGNAVTVAAPGGDVRSSAANGILSTLNNGSTTPGSDAYAWYQGTSMATPHVVGVVALMLSKNAALTPDEVATRLRNSARAFPASCSGCGGGIVNASAAVDAAGGGTPPPPTSGNEVEPNNSTGTAQALARGTTVNGTMASSSDNDYFRVTVAAGSALTARLAPNATSDYDLYVYNSAGSQVGRSILGTGQVDTVSITNGGASATYYVRVRFYSGATGTSGSYTLSVN